MSQDLFAAFGSANTCDVDSDSNGSRKPAVNSVNGLHRAGDVDDGQAQEFNIEGDDDFGDFEDAAQPPPSVQEPPQKAPSLANKPTVANDSANQKPIDKPAKDDAGTGSHPFAGRMDLLFGDEDDDEEYHAGADEITDLANNPEAAMAYSKRVIAEQQAEQERRKGPLVAPTEPPRQQDGPKKLRKKSGYMPTRNPDVLFDADTAADEDVDDDFGDFEDFGSAGKAAGQPTASIAKPVTKAFDLLNLEDGASRRTASSRLASAKPMTTDTGDDGDAWDDFEVSSVPARQPANAALPAGGFEDSPFQRSTAALAGKPAGQQSMEALPPTNIPPPAVLLSVFPSIFASGEEALLGPLGKLEFKQKQVLLAHPATHMFLRGYLTITIVLGHIIAGRKLRWKRDQRLAQSMRIGPAAAGGKGGMKLAGIDKGEVAKEDREVLDALRVWKGQAGKLRSAVTTASSSTSAGEAKLPAVPELAEQMPVRTLKPAEGGVTAPQACALCGLKREERVAKVDLEVNDSFGEWWVDGMNMHLLCKNFWEEHKGKLKSR